MEALPISDPSHAAASGGPNPGTSSLSLDVIVPTYNRETLLRKTLESFAQADLPPGLCIAVVVVANNCTDGTAALVAAMQPGFPLTLRYLHETRQGLSHARNAGITASRADLVAFIDDDEEIEPDWFRVIAREFVDPAVQFIGGPYLANWVASAPGWLPPGYNAVIGVVSAKPRGPIDATFQGNLMGGNAVFRRGVFDRIGLYAPQLGRGAKGLLSEEDADLQRRLQAAGIFGIHVPDLAIRHYIGPERLTRSYHRRWVYWRSASQGILDRTRPDATLKYLFGVPRYRFGEAGRGLIAAPWLRLSGRKAQAFRAELSVVDLVGFIYGRFFLRVEKMYTPAEPQPPSSSPNP